MGIQFPAVHHPVPGAQGGVQQNQQQAAQPQQNAQENQNLLNQNVINDQFVAQAAPQPVEQQANQPDQFVPQNAAVEPNEPAPQPLPDNDPHHQPAPIEAEQQEEPDNDPQHQLALHQADDPLPPLQADQGQNQPLNHPVNGFPNQANGPFVLPNQIAQDNDVDMQDAWNNEGVPMDVDEVGAPEAVPAAPDGDPQDGNDPDEDQDPHNPPPV